MTLANQKSDIGKGVMDGIGATTVSTDRDSADIRFYCDNDVTSKTHGPTARWQLVPDRDQDPDGFKNSQRTEPYSQEWYDQYNFMRRPRNTMGCQNQYTLAETCKLRHKKRSALICVCTAVTRAVSASDPRVQDQNQNRSVITVVPFHTFHSSLSVLTCCGLGILTDSASRSAIIISALPSPSRL